MVRLNGLFIITYGTDPNQLYGMHHIPKEFKFYLEKE